MRAIRRCVVALSLLTVLVSSSAAATPRGSEKLKLPRLIQRLLDYLDSKLTVPPI